MGIAELDGETPPPYNAIRELFELIDLRKDDEISFVEWKKTFARGLTLRRTKGPQREEGWPAARAGKDLLRSPKYRRIVLTLRRRIKFIEDELREMQNRRLELTFDRVRERLAQLLEEEGLELTTVEWGELLSPSEHEGRIRLYDLLSDLRNRAAAFHR
eukprot:TRINITY_DN13666_c0_g1_i1.p1 TRINITY_DN13666_c0_g1~~TRINITY_DN13666_c0_g1_i1.p1  ORF type:complete len:159 (-),score=48.14 TRINITY_DN13666_c0_g1_i1:93-569(-)